MEVKTLHSTLYFIHKNLRISGEQMENEESIILKINLNSIDCEGRKWTKNLLESGSESYSCLTGGPISPERLHPEMKAFIRLDGKLKYDNTTIDKGIQIECKVINSRKDSEEPVDLELVQLYSNRISDSLLKSIGINLSHGHRGHRYTNLGDEIKKQGLGIKNL